MNTATFTGDNHAYRRLGWLVIKHKATESDLHLAGKASEAQPFLLADNAEGMAVLAVLDRIAAQRKSAKRRDDK
ncbi:MAG TPA: hypothetical protein VFO29_01615 [Candidatus Rubrimentiphilum sp.]|nr:hypothetical protein [Candidatus Rubrimentiphilum sp.]